MNKSVAHSTAEKTNSKPLHFVLFIALLLSTLAAFAELDDKHFVDIAYFKSAATLFLNGGNPYDLHAIHSLAKELRECETPAIILWPPPSMFCFTLPFTLVSYDSLRRIWLVFCVMVFVISYLLLQSRITKRARAITILEILFFLSYHPLLSTIQYGQAGFIVFMSVIGFFLVMQRADYSKKMSLLSGALLSVSFIKPHLLFLFYVAICIERLKKRDWPFLFGFAGVAVLLHLFPLLIRPDIYNLYFAAISARPPTYLFNPTIGGWLQLYFPSIGNVVRFMPTALAAVAVGLWFIKRKHEMSPELTALLIGLSICLSPYNWLYDYTLFLPALVIAFSDIHAQYDSNRAHAITLAAGFLLVNIIAFLQPSKMHYFVWYSFALLILCYFSTRCFRAGNTD